MAATERDLLEVLNSIDSVEERIGRDVKKFCALLKIIMESPREQGVNLSLQENRNLKSILQRNFLAIYMCLKLHLAFHFGEDFALHHKELSALGSQLSDEPEVNTLPGTRHAIDPGSKLLEIVSMQFLAYGTGAYGGTELQNGCACVTYDPVGETLDLTRQLSLKLILMIILIQ